jgi:D-serine deaminase-like pyridoxal phosphate-dependent protein
MLVSALDTPAVTIDLDRLDANIRRVQAQLDAQGVANRPHIKTHKIPAIAKMQLEAGASGITCQKLGEMEVFVDAGIADDIMLTFNVIGAAKTERLMALNKRVKRLLVVLDNETVARGLSDAARGHNADIRFLVECDTGMGRNGVQTPEAARGLAEFAMNLPRMHFEGLMTYPNSFPRTAEFFDRALKLFADEGIPVPIVSGGGTPALPKVGEFPMLTEHRAGTYVFNDKMMVHSGVASWDDCALRIRMTVVSRPTPDRAILDGGSKALTSDQYYVKDYGHILEFPDARIAALSEEHAMVDLSACKERPEVGEIVSVVPNHCCSATNMHDEVYGVRNGAVEVVWPVAARGKIR